MSGRSCLTDGVSCAFPLGGCLGDLAIDLADGVFQTLPFGGCSVALVQRMVLFVPFRLTDVRDHFSKI